MTDRQAHWAEVYRTKSTEKVSWFQPRAARSMTMIRATGIGHDSAIIDVGGGASVLAGELLAEGFHDVSVLDIAEEALSANRKRLGPQATQVAWIRADVLNWAPPRRYDLWHDRAVFHFLVAPEDRSRYRAVLNEGLKSGGWLVMATFALEGPERCSNLPVHRWSAEALAQELGPAFQLVERLREDHRTPGGAIQPFTWCRFRYLPSG